jgi:hypothetical protein
MEKLSTPSKTCHSPNLSTTNPKWTALVSKACLRAAKPVTVAWIIKDDSSVSARKDVCKDICAGHHCNCLCTSCKMGKRVISPGVQWPGRDVDL